MLEWAQFSLNVPLLTRKCTDGLFFKLCHLKLWYTSRCLTPAERNCDVGNRELLAIKLALDEWRHGLERAEQPFLVGTDYKNLE